jgi:hypothetical protein
LSTLDVSDPNIYPNSPGTYNPITHQYDAGELDLLNIDPSQTTLYVTKDLRFVILDGNPNINNGISQVSVSSVQQSYHQVPEPTTIIAGALLLLPFGASTLRILRKNRMT